LPEILNLKQDTGLHFGLKILEIPSGRKPRLPMRLQTTSGTDDQSVLRLHTIVQARRNALAERSETGAGGVAPWIERSWQRCLALGLQPHKPVTFALISDQETRRTAEANQHLVHTAQPLLEKLGRAIANTHYFAILTNAQGVVVDVGGAIDRSDPRADLITRIGTDLSENSVGTTAIGSALTELQPVWLHRGEHFFDSTSVYSCAGAPLFGPNGDCVGMLDVTGIDAVERPELKHLVTQTANKIENALVLSQDHSLMVRLNWPGNALGSETDGILCLDADGWITGANPTARQMVPNLHQPSRQAVHVSEVFGIPYQMLFDRVRRSDATLEIPLWTGLLLQALPIERAREKLDIQGTQKASATAQTQSQRPLKEIETALILTAVEQARGNVAQAAQALGISRATVYRTLGRRT
jgi:transcriptional regulator of acetoin/glycerol metabolism